MKKSGAFRVAAALLGMALPALSADLYTSDREVAIRTPADHTLATEWLANELGPVREASDCVLVRRLYLDLVGRLPSVEEARNFVRSQDPGKYEVLADALLADDGFVAYWSMRFGEMLRVKSEFPINLWPNAVYVYMRRIREFLHNDEPYHEFVRELLLSGGSNFRDAPVNFYRAHADRSPRGIAGNVASTLCGIRLETLPESEQQAWTRIFEEIGFKNTKEWKEEVVYLKKLPPRDIVLPDGKHVAVPEGGEARRLLADHLTRGDGRKILARSMVNRTWRWFFGAGLARVSEEEPGNPELLEMLTDEFVRNGFHFRQLCRAIVTGAAYRSASFQDNAAAKARHFAAYPVRRLEAEVLDDALADLTGVSSRYSSVIPEPFTFIPQEMRTVEIADGSISSSFLILFGRPSRDAGTPDERNDRINAKQRLFLFNSGALYRRLSRIPRRPEFRNKPVGKQLEQLYWMFYSRPPTPEESRAVMKRYRAVPPKNRWRFFNDLVWTMVNSAEFLHRH